VRILYNILAYLAMPIVLVRLLIRSIRLEGYRKHLPERFGFVPKASQPCIWFHAVSVGESIAAVPLVKRCLEVYPTCRIVVTNTTPTGRDRTQAALKGRVENYYIPYDIPGALKRFIRRMQPKLLVLMETELWPNLLYYAKQHQINVVLANARLSERSASNYASAPYFTKDMFLQLDFVAVQADADNKRFMTLGVDKSKIETVGSVKYDLAIPDSVMKEADELRKEIGVDRPIWVASSTHAGEEEPVLAAHKKVLEKFPTAMLVLVPRHPNRFDIVAGMLEKSAWRFVRRSHAKADYANAQIFLGDTMGEMLMFNAMSDVVFVAGSFAPIGGHNTMEPAAFAKPVLQGPVWHNFVKATQLLTEANAIIEVKDSNALADTLCDLFANPDKAIELGQRAKAVIDANRGSVEKQFQIIEKYLPPEISM
jgi:3-deoxy-D-manno-octulosonic-acid transferase